MEKEIKNYFRNLLKYSCFLQQGETLLVQIPKYVKNN